MKKSPKSSPTKAHGITTKSPKTTSTKEINFGAYPIGAMNTDADGDYDFGMDTDHDGD